MIVINQNLPIFFCFLFCFFDRNIRTLNIALNQFSIWRHIKIIKIIIFRCVSIWNRTKNYLTIILHHKTFKNWFTHLTFILYQKTLYWFLCSFFRIFLEKWIFKRLLFFMMLYDNSCCIFTGLYKKVGMFLKGLKMYLKIN